MNTPFKHPQIAATVDVQAHPSPTARLISAATVREIFGGMSDMTLWRRLQDERLAFPQPIVIARTRYWREAEVWAWIDQRAAAKAIE